MTRSLRKYLTVADLHWQRWLAYRFDFLLDVAFSFIPTVVTVLVWQAVFAQRYGGAATVGAYTLAQAITYTLLSRLLAALLSTERLQSELIIEIREGGLSKLLVKPIDALGYRLAVFLAQGAAYALAVAVPNLAIFWVLRRYFLPPAGGADLALAIMATGLAALLAFALGHLVATLAFWWEEVSSVLYLEQRVLEFFAGTFVPLDLMPRGLVAVMRWLPFEYLAYFPAKVYLGQLTAAEIQRGLFTQGVWVSVLLFLAANLWRRGLRRYTAAGM